MKKSLKYFLLAFSLMPNAYTMDDNTASELPVEMKQFGDYSVYIEKPDFDQLPYEIAEEAETIAYPADEAIASAAVEGQTEAEFIEQANILLAAVDQNPELLNSEIVEVSLLTLYPSMLRDFMETSNANFVPTFAEKSSDELFLRTISESDSLFQQEAIQQRLYSLGTQNIKDFITAPENENLISHFASTAPNELFLSICEQSNIAFITQEKCRERLDTFSLEALNGINIAVIEDQGIKEYRKFTTDSEDNYTAAEEIKISSAGYAHLIEPTYNILSNPQIVAATIVAGASAASAVALDTYYKLQTSFALAQLDTENSNSNLSASDRAFLKTLQNNGNIISYTFSIDQEAKPLMTQNVNLASIPKPVATSSQQASSEQKSYETPSSLRVTHRGDHFALVLDESTASSSTAPLSNEKLAGLRLQAEQIKSDQGRNNQRAIAGEINKFQASHTLNMVQTKISYEAKQWATMQSARLKSAVADIKKKYPHINGLASADQWPAIVTHAEDSDFVHMLTIDSKIASYPLVEHRFGELLKTANSEIIDQVVSPVFPSDVFIKHSEAIYTKAIEYGKLEHVDAQLLRCNNYKELFNKTHQQLLEKQVTSIHERQKDIAQCKSLLDNSDNLTDSDKIALKQLFIKYHTSSELDKFQYGLHQTGSYVTFMRTVGRIERQQIRAHLANKNKANHLAYALEKSKMADLIGPQLCNSKEYKAIVKHAHQQAVQNGHSFEYYLHLSRRTAIPKDLLAQQYENIEQIRLELDLIQALGSLLPISPDPKAIEQLVHYGLIANKAHELHEARNILQILSDIKSTCADKLRPEHNKEFEEQGSAQCPEMPESETRSKHRAPIGGGHIEMPASPAEKERPLISTCPEEEINIPDDPCNYQKNKGLVQFDHPALITSGDGGPEIDPEKENEAAIEGLSSKEQAESDGNKILVYLSLFLYQMRALKKMYLLI